MAIFERGETYAHWITIRDRDDTKISPSTVLIYIYDPCGRTLVNGNAMTSSATGVYYYNYDTISSSATYGKYEVKVVAQTGSNIGTYISHFYVMPWKIEESVRQKIGVTDFKDIDDDALSELCWSAYKKVLRDVFIHKYADVPNGNPDTGVEFDGINVYFQTSNYPIADINGDGEVSGTVSCATDITCWWINSAGSRQEGFINIINAKNGEIEIYQSDGVTPIPSNNKGVYLDYWYEYESFDEFLFRESVCYLAAHYVNLRLTERNKVTLADISKNTPIVMLYPDRYLNEYKKLVKKVSKPKIGGV